MSVCEAARRLALGALILCSLCQQLRCQETPSGPGLRLTLDEGGVGGVPLTVEQTRSISLVSGLSYNIMCNAERGFGGSEMVWFRDGVPLPNRAGQTIDPTISSVHAIRVDGNNWRLVLQLFMNSGTGRYTCEGSNGNVSLVIGIRNPTVVAGSPLLPIAEGAFISGRPTLVAFVSGFPAPTSDNITWYFNNGPLLPEFELFQGRTELSLPRIVEARFSGIYTIQVTTSNGTVTESFEVIVTKQPNPSISPSVGQVRTNGTDITLSCMDRDGVPAPDFIWFIRDNVPINETSRISITRSMVGNTTFSNLTISPLFIGDDGTYKCTARNIHNGLTTVPLTVAIEVQFRPILRASSSQLRWAVNSNALLQTLLVNANPNTSINVQWLDPSGNLISISQYSTSVDNNGSTVYEVTLPSLGENDGGIYTCVVENSIGISRQTFDLFITLPPILQHTNDGSTGVRTLLGGEKGQMVLSANILGARPPVMPRQISWRKDGNNTPINNDSGKYIITTLSSQTNLTITNLRRMDDTGLYTVTAMHEAGSASLQFNLEVLRAPRPPTRLSATAVNACVVDITWELERSVSPGFAQPLSVIFEVFVLGSEQYLTFVPIGSVNLTDEPQPTSFRGMVPPGGDNSTYNLRARASNPLTGEGDDFLASDIFMAYNTEEFFPVLTGVGGQASNDSETLTVVWTPPTDKCFNSSTFNISCMPLERVGVASSGENRANGDLGRALVRGLTPDTFYNCSVVSTFEGFTATRVTYTIKPIFTFPPKPAAPGVKTIVDRKPTPSTITEEFTLPAGHQNISHYRVYVVRLAKRARPDIPPDELFSDDSRISTYETVNIEDPFEDQYLAYITAEIDATLFKPRFTIGDGSQTDRKEQFPNAPLQANSFYTFFLRAYPKTRGDFPSSFRTRRESSSRQYAVFSSSDYTAVSYTESPSTGGNSPAVTDIAVGVVVGVFLFLVVLTIIVIIILYLIVRSSKSSSYKPDRFPSVDSSPSMSYDATPDFISMVDTPDLTRKINGGHELKNMDGQFLSRSPFVPRGLIKREKFAEHVEKFDSNRQLLFQEEYEYISQSSPWNPAEASNHPLNDEKNRYSNITAFDHSRVELMSIDEIECSDYINANYIAGYHSEQEYIATQGPLEQTVEDFWRMVWEQQTATIVMLTNIVELGKIKCAQYWPQTGKLIYGNLKVTLENTVELPDYTIRDLSVEHMITGDTRTVLQFHYIRWPDYGTPQLAAPLLNFLRALNSSNPEGAGPMVVHCSAGVGRSGTVIAIDYCLNRLKEEGIIDVCDFVSRMRRQRNYMVQTEQQYTFIHYAILESIAYGDTSFPLTGFTSLYEKLRAVNPESKKTLMDEEYSRLGQVKTMVKKSAFQKRLKRKGEPPRHFESSFRGAVSTMDSSDNYSGHFVDSYSEKRRYIVAEGPQESTTAKFWQVVWDEDCSFVVMLTPKDSPLLFPYWPSEGEEIQHGNVVVRVEKESQEHLYTKREIKLTNAKVSGISHKLVQYQFMGWMEDNFPRVPDFVKFVCDVVSGVRDMKGNKKVLMHDTDSLGPAGIMCALCYCIDRLSAERMVDIFQAVQIIQLQRPGSIKTMTQYAFTYDCVYEYIRTYSSSP